MTANIEDLRDSGFIPPAIKTKQLLLRSCIASDFDAIHSYAQIEALYRYIRPYVDEEPTRRMVATLMQPWMFEVGVWHGLIINLLDEKLAIGDVVFRVDDAATRRIEIGYRLSPEYAGRGIISEAASAVLDMLFTELDITKVVARCDPRNVPSFKIMEKLGMKREAEFKAHYLNGNELTDQYDYGILRSEWLHHTR